MVVADFVESDGFYAVGFLVAETVGAGGLESYSEAFAGKSDGGIEIGAVGKVERQAYPLQCSTDGHRQSDRAELFTRKGKEFSFAAFGKTTSSS